MKRSIFIKNTSFLPRKVQVNKSRNESLSTHHSIRSKSVAKSKHPAGLAPSTKLSSDSKNNQLNKSTHLPFKIHFTYILLTEPNQKSVSSKYCFEKAIDLYNKNKIPLAGSMFKKVIDIDRVNYNAWNNLGICLIMQNDLGEAMSCFHEASKLDKANEVGYYNISLAYLKSDKPQEAYLCMKSAEGLIFKPSEQFDKLQRYIMSYSADKELSMLGRRAYEDSKRHIISKSNQRINVNLNTSFESKSNDSQIGLVKGFNQTDIIDVQDKEIDFPEKKFAKLREIIKQDMKNMRNEKIYTLDKLESKYLTIEELKIVKNEFVKHDSERDYSKIDQIFDKLLFFQRFAQETRRKIYAISEIKCYLSGETVFSEGDIGENMYVILKGAITIEKVCAELRGQKMVVNSIYDGRQFGELALLNSLDSSLSKNERTASCIACEKSYLLCMPKLDLSSIILISNKKDLDYATSFFSSLSLFKGFESNALLSFASNIDRFTYKLNEIILHKGESPKGLYVISKGYVVLYTEGFTTKEKYSGEYSPLRTQKPRPSPMYFSLTPPSKKIRDEADNEKFICDNTQESEIGRFLSKEEMKKVKTNESYLIKDKLPFASLKEFDFFGGRVLVSHKEEPSKPSKFTVVAQSSTVEVFVITKYHLQFLSQEIKTQLITILEKSYEVDCPPEVNPREMDRMFKGWQNYKHQLVQNIRKEGYISRNKTRAAFPG